MNLVLGMIVRNEADILPLTLPVTRGVPTLKIALDFSSTDGTPSILSTHGWHVEPGGEWRNDYAWARNELLDWGRRIAPWSSWMLQLDADECMWPEDVETVGYTTQTTKLDLIALPRYNLAGRGMLWMNDSYPDPQTRVVRLSSDKRYRLPVHEVIDGDRLTLTEPHIYHYGQCKSPRSSWLRSHNYTLIGRGEKPVTSTPDWVSDDYNAWLCDMASRHNFVAFPHNHPLRDKL
jgi:hypothetical protein